jgi:hypothetical protein
MKVTKLFPFGVGLGGVFFNEDRRTGIRRLVVAIPLANASLKTSVKYVIVLFSAFWYHTYIRIFIGVLQAPI